MNENILKWRKKLPKLLLELLVFLLLLLALEAFLTRDAVSGRAPLFTAETIQGEAFDLRQLRGQPSVIHFWATWCPVCELEQGTIDSLAADYPFISVAMQSGEPAEVVAYLDEQGVDYPVVNDPDGVMARRYGVSGVPATFILDAGGEVRFVTRGYTSGLGLRLRLWWAGVAG
ncbi:MAG: protein disulfide oxidoreductase [Pseudomonadota bacterium]